MTIEDVAVVDIVSLDPVSGLIDLTICDHLGWECDEDDHLLLLQEKLNAYIRFVENGELIGKYPEAIGRGVVIDLRSLHPLSDKATQFFELARLTVREAGIELTF